MKRGDILPDEGAQMDDGWMVLRAGPGEVIAADLCCWAIYRWVMAWDGIRVSVSTVVMEGVFVVEGWESVAVTVHPPPPEIAAHLRERR